MLNLEDERADLDGSIELFADLALECLRMRLAFGDLAAGKLPRPGEVCALEPARQQERAVLFDHRRDDNDHDSRESFAKDLHMRVIGHAMHFGLRATHTVAPKSMIPWLKSKTCLCGTSVSDSVQSCLRIA